ncbi:MAG TPA: RHS repeat-associated core domain-containing protein [Polyangiaceae bacterium]|nr:RHS repeat-associated core domain-containing protein [Polyangiaceae bacterium]
MTRPRSVWISFFGLLLTVASGCGDGGKHGAPVAGEAPAEADCGDGKDNDGDGFVDCEDLDCRTTSKSCELAPALDRTVATTVWESAQFLFTGKDPIQKGTKPKQFSRKRIAILRGKVVDRAGKPLAGVQVSVAGHDEWGTTSTRSDGLFDFAVNGGSELLVQFSRDGYLAAERGVAPHWESYQAVPSVGLVEEGSSATKVAAHLDHEQVAVGDAVEDELGSRQPLLVFVRDLTATATLADGSEKELQEFHVRLTEYPFEAPSREALNEPSRFAPGTTPTRGGITYGIEASIDEARELGASGVHFSAPISIVVENFLKLPVGSPVPLGYYERGKGHWQPEQGGRVIEVLGVTGDEANVDADGDGESDDDSALTDLGVSHAERRELARRYKSGATLWHLSIDHFSPHLSTIPLVAPHNAVAPTAAVTLVRHIDEPTRRGPVLIERQALSQAFGVAATPYSLVYQSDRTPGYRQGYHVELPVIGKAVPEGLKQVVAQLSVAGQVQNQVIEPDADATASFDWDGKDAFGRLVQGQQRADVSVSYVYDAELRPSDAFGQASNATIGIDGVALETSLSRAFTLTLGTWDAGGYGLGGFSIDALHALDPATQTIYFGWGDERTAQNVALVATRPARDTAALGTPDGITVAPDGSLIVTDDEENGADGQGRLLRIAPEGDVTVLAGPGGLGAAAKLALSSPQGVVMKGDGSVIVADYGLNAVREIAPDGSVQTLIGDASENPVLEADVSALDGIALGQRGELYLVNRNQVLRFEGGTLSAFAGNGQSSSDRDPTAADSLVATAVPLATPSGVAVGPDGSVFITERDGNRVRRVSPNGAIDTVVGTGVAGFSGDGQPAVAAQLDGPRGIAVSGDGSLYIADQNNNRIRRVTPDGVIQTIVGGGDAKLTEGQLAEKVKLNAPDGIAFGNDGALYIADVNTVYKIAPGLPEISEHEALIPSTDGHTLYRFDAQGKHQETIDAVTGVSQLTFRYTDAGLLDSIVDHFGLTTTFERGKDGALEAISGPFGQRTTFDTNDNSQIEGITDPLTRKISLEYKKLDLLTKVVSPKGAETSFEYFDDGRLKQITDPTGYFETYSPKQGNVVEATTAEGYLTSYQIAGGAAGLVERTITPPTKAAVKWSDEVTRQAVESPDGSSSSTFLVPDQAFGAQTLLPSNTIVKTPGGRSLEVDYLETKKLTDPKNFLTANEWDHLVQVGDRVSETQFRRSDRTITTTSPMGRQSSVVLDANGLPTDITAPGVGTLHRDYDKLGHLVGITATAGKETRSQTFVYDDNGFVNAVTNARQETSSFERDIVGRLLGVTAPDKSVTRQDLDDDDKLLDLFLPSGAPHHFEYQGVSAQLVETLPPAVDGEGPNGFAIGETHYQYDKHQQLIQIQRSDGDDINFKYSGVTGQLETVKTSGITVTNGYDGIGRLNRISRSDGVTVDLGFDGPLPTSVEWSGGVKGKVTADYDDFFQLKTLTVNDASSASYEYDLDGAVTRASGNGHALDIDRDPDTGFVTGTTLGTVATTYGYTGFGELNDLSANFQGKTVFSQALTRDELGRITGITEQSANVTRSVTYGYDNMGRLAQIDRDGSTTVFKYDANGNRTSVEVDGTETLTATYDAQDRVQTFGDVTFEQTAHGDLLRRTNANGGALELEYDSLGNLLSATASTPKTTKNVTYTVDGMGRRVGRQVGGKFSRAWLYQDALRPVSEITDTGVFSQFVYAGGGSAPDFMLRGGVAFRFVKDRLGSVRFVVNATTGVVAQALEYDEFGNVTRDTAPGFQPFGFAGGLYDVDTGLVRFGARDYDPTVGRWTSKDPIGFEGGANLYVYCGNDPINCTDPTGNSPQEDYRGSFGYWVTHTNNPWVSWVQNDRGLEIAQNVALGTANLAASIALWELAIPRLMALAGGGSVAAVTMRSSSLAMGVERATPQLLESVAGHGRMVEIAAEGSEELRYLNSIGAEANVGGPNLTHILLRANPSKAAVLEEFLHGTQWRLGIVQRLGVQAAETHVKSFMIRHAAMLGLGAEDVAALKQLMEAGL